MNKSTAKEILQGQSLEQLIEAYYEEFRHDNRLPELFEMIEPERLYEWIIDSFISEFSRSEIVEIFEWKDDDEH